MSHMYRVVVVARGPRHVDLELRQDHPDYGSFPSSRFFGLQLLLHRAHKPEESGQWVAASPLGEAVPFGTYETMFDSQTGAELAPAYVANLEVLRAERVPFDQDATLESIAARLRADGLSEGDDEWEEAVEAAWQSFWEETPPTVLVRITVTDPRWVEHLPEGTTFEGAGYCLAGPWIEADVG